MPDTIRIDRAGGVATVTLERPDIHNAFSPDMIADLTEAFEELGGDGHARAIVLTGAGKSFSAGADLNWMKSMATYTEADNVADARRLDAMFHAMITCPKPIVGRVNGAAIGGGLGLVASCDMTVGARGAKFGFSEVRLGVAPAVIAPYVLRKTGVGPLGEYFLTGARFDADRAREVGLLQYVVEPDELDAAVAAKVRAVLQCAPGAVGAAKELINTVSATPLDEVREYTAQLIARLRAGAEGQEGMAAFLEKRKPSWVTD